MSRFGSQCMHVKFSLLLGASTFDAQTFSDCKQVSNAQLCNHLEHCAANLQVSLIPVFVRYYIFSNIYSNITTISM